MSRLILGTVQFGLDYGIKNARGKIPETEVAKILDLAEAGLVDTLDTASAYGNSESVLGRVLGGKPRFRIISKLRTGFEGTVRQELEASLERLRSPRLHAYLLHNFEIYRSRTTTISELAYCKREGLIEKVGVSLYHPAEVHTLLKAAEPIDIVQVPYSMLDRRFESVFPLLRKRGIEIHVRSIFLQGALLMDPETLPQGLSPLRERLTALCRLSETSGMSVSAICLAFAANNPLIDAVVIGIDGLDDLAANLESFRVRGSAVRHLSYFEDIRTDDENIILPYRWKEV